MNMCMLLRSSASRGTTDLLQEHRLTYTRPVIAERMPTHGPLRSAHVHVYYISVTTGMHHGQGGDVDVLAILYSAHILITEVLSLRKIIISLLIISSL